jgi:hypothetical protein
MIAAYAVRLLARHKLQSDAFNRYDFSGIAVALPFALFALGQVNAAAPGNNLCGFAVSPHGYCVGVDSLRRTLSRSDYFAIVTCGIFESGHILIFPVFGVIAAYAARYSRAA